MSVVCAASSCSDAGVTQGHWAELKSKKPLTCDTSGTLLYEKEKGATCVEIVAPTVFISQEIRERKIQLVWFQRFGESP